MAQDWLDISTLINSYRRNLTLQATNLGPSQTGPQMDPARQILLNTNVNWSVPPNDLSGRTNRGGPSVLSRIFDILSRPRYAAAEATRQVVQRDDENIGDDIAAGLSGFWQGLSGKRKTSWTDVIREGEFNLRPEQFIKPDDPEDFKKLNPDYQPNPNDPNDFKLSDTSMKVFGFGGDLLFDPLNLIGAGTIRAGVNLGRKALGIAPKASPLEGLRPGASISTQMLPFRPPETPVPSLIPQNQQLPPGLARTPQPESPAAPILFESPGLASEAIISPATRAINEAADFPNVPLPRSPVTQTNREIKDLIREIADTAGVARPKYIHKMNKQELAFTLKRLQQTSGRTALSRATQTEALPAKPPKINVNRVIDKSRRSKETAEALKLAQKYEDEVLTKPNKFPTPGRQPAVNNPAQQVNFFNNKILPAARALYPKRHKTAINSVALRMLKDAEDAFEAKGLHPAFWSGVPFKLSEVIDRVGGFKAIGREHLTRIMTALGNQDTSKITDPKVRQVLDELISEQKLKETPYIDLALRNSVDEASVAQATMSQPKFEAFKKQIAQAQNVSLKQPKQMIDLAPNVPLYITPKSVKTANMTLKEIFKASTPLPQQAINSNIKTVQQYIRSDGTSFWAPVNRAITNAIHQTIGGPTPRQLGTKIGEGSKAEAWILSRISTAYGNKDLRPDVLITQQSARARATRRTKVLNNIAKQYTAPEIEEAFKVAQGAIPGSSERVDDLAEIFTKTLENLFDAGGVAQKGNSVAYRTGMTMKEINKQLKYMKAGFKFTNSPKAVDALGNIHDFSKGNDWLNSWRIAQTSDPLVFMSKVQAAVENVVAKNSFLDDFAARWGSRHYDPKHGFTKKIADPRLKGLYYNPELADQMSVVLKNWDQIYDPKSPLVKLFDQATSMWKTGITIYMPAHHIRNLIGDIYLGWMDGVNSIKPYRIASKVMWSQRNRYNDIQSIENLVSPKAISTALTRPGDNVLTTRGGLDLTAEQLYTAAFNKGLLQSANVVEDIITDTIPKIKPLGGHVGKAARGFAEGRDHFARLAHFIDVIEKSRGKNIEQIFDEAAKRTRKWHPDGMDLTDFERKYLRRIAPFYSWTRKSIPLVIESAVFNPAKTMAYPKTMYGIQQLMGVESASIGDPFPEDQLFPDWIKEKGIGPIAAHGMSGIPGAIAGLSRSRPGFTGEPEGYTVVNPGNPFIDTVSQFAGMGRFRDTRSGVAQMINPAFRIPAEVGTGHTVLGTPVDYDPNKYVTENVPLVAYLSQLGNIGVFGPTERGSQEGIPNTEGIINWLTAAGMRGTGASIKQAEFEARERAKAERGR